MPIHHVVLVHVFFGLLIAGAWRAQTMLEDKVRRLRQSHGVGHLCREQDELLRELQAQLSAEQRDAAAGHACEVPQQDGTAQLEVHSQDSVPLLAVWRACSLRKGCNKLLYCTYLMLSICTLYQTPN